MKILKFITIIFVLVFIIGCNNKKSHDKNSHSVSLVEDAVDKTEFVEEFLKFYADNYDDIYSNDFVDYSKEFYRIDHNNVKLFLDKIDSEKYFTNRYKDSITNYFKEIDLVLENKKQNDGFPEGLEFDLILHTQDIDELLSIIKNSNMEISKIKKGIYEVNLGSVYKLLFLMEEGKINNILLP